MCEGLLPHKNTLLLILSWAKRCQSPKTGQGQGDPNYGNGSLFCGCWQKVNNTNTSWGVSRPSKPPPTPLITPAVITIISRFNHHLCFTLKNQFAFNSLFFFYQYINIPGKKEFSGFVSLLLSFPVTRHKHRKSPHKVTELFVYSFFFYINNLKIHKWLCFKCLTPPPTYSNIKNDTS